MSHDSRDRNKHRRKHHKKHLEKKDIATIVIIILVVIGIGLFIGMDVIPKMKEKKKETAELQTGGYSYEGNNSENEITYNGKKYKYNNHLTNILVMGTDKTAEYEADPNKPYAGSCDTIYLISQNRLTGETKIFNIPRDTMTRIEKFDQNGNSTGYEVDHLATQYAFGDGKHGSCRLVKSAVSNLFHGVPILKYAALNLDSIRAIAELAGEVRVTVPNDSLEYKYPEFAAGTEVILTPDNTEIFVRNRDTDTEQSAFARSERQNAYLNALRELSKQKLQTDPGFLSTAYSTMTPYLTTNMDNGEMVDLLESLTNSTGDSITIPGQIVHNGQYDEYHVDEDAMFTFVLNHFYT